MCQWNSDSRRLPSRIKNASYTILLFSAFLILRYARSPHPQANMSLNGKIVGSKKAVHISSSLT